MKLLLLNIIKAFNVANYMGIGIGKMVKKNIKVIIIYRNAKRKQKS